MVIQCKQCETKYNLDETLLKNGSIDVRCVRCQTVFNVSATPQQSEEQAILAPQEAPEPSIEKSETETQLPTDTVPDWGDNEDNFSFTEEPDAFSFQEESPGDLAPEEDQHPDDLTTPSPFENTEPAEDSLPQEFSFDSIDEEPAAEQDLAEQIFGAETAEADDTTEATTAPTAAPAVEKKAAPRKKEKRKTSKLAWLLLILLMIVAGAYGYFYVTLGTTDVMQMIQKVQQQFLPPAPQQPQGSIRVDTGESYYIENTVAGQLFVIQGKAINKFSTPRSELKVTATLYKKKGIPLLSQSAYCGNIISKKGLENLPLKELLNTTNNPFGDSLSNVNIAPGQSLPFMIVFSEIPEDLSEFSVEAESSKAAAK